MVIKRFQIYPDKPTKICYGFIVGVLYLEQDSEGRYFVHVNCLEDNIAASYSGNNHRMFVYWVKPEEKIPLGGTYRGTATVDGELHHLFSCGVESETFGEVEEFTMTTKKKKKFKSTKKKTVKKKFKKKIRRN